MTETEAQDAYYGALAHERELQLELAITDALISAATVYRDTVAKPGWANSVNYVTFAGTGLCMIAAAAGAPAGLIGGALYVAGVYTASYGVFGYSQYASQAISRSFPGLPGASHDAT